MGFLNVRVFEVYEVLNVRLRKAFYELKGTYPSLSTKALRF
jgi:hypothetical protein